MRLDEMRMRTMTSPHCVGILGLDCDERFAIAKLNWNCEGRTDGRRIDWRKLATTGGLYIYANQKLCDNNREHCTLLYTKGIQGE